MKVKFFYATGTSYMLNMLELGFSVSIGGEVHVFGQIGNPVNRRSATIGGLPGKTAMWDGQPQNDPFPFMLDPDLFDSVRIMYQAEFLSMDA